VEPGRDLLGEDAALPPHRTRGVGNRIGQLGDVAEGLGIDHQRRGLSVDLQREGSEPEPNPPVGIGMHLHLDRTPLAVHSHDREIPSAADAVAVANDASLHRVDALLHLVAPGAVGVHLGRILTTTTTRVGVLHTKERHLLLVEEEGLGANLLGLLLLHVCLSVSVA